MLSRRQILLTGGAAVSTSLLAGCTGLTKNAKAKPNTGPTYHYQGYLDQSPFTDGPRVPDGPPFYASVFTNEANATDQISWEALTEPLVHRLQGINHESEFVTIFVSRYELDSPDVFHGGTVLLSFEKEKTVFNVNIDGWPPKAGSESEPQFYVDIQIFSKKTMSPSTNTVIQLPGKTL